MFALKKGSQLSVSTVRRRKHSNLGKVSNGDKSEASGGPFPVSNVVGSGSRMMCRIAVSVNGTDTATVVRPTPQDGGGEEVRNSAITVTRSAKASMSDKLYENVNFVR